MAGGTVSANALRGETSLLRHRSARGVGLILGMLVAFLVAGVLGMVAFFVFAAAARPLAHLVSRSSDHL